MTILVNEDTRILVQGITGSMGSRYVERMREFNTQVVGGVTPGKGGEWEQGLPVFDTMRAAVNATGANATLICVPEDAVVDAIYEALDSGVALAVCLTANVPIHDMLRIHSYAERRQVKVIGPGSVGVLSPPNIMLGALLDAAVAKGDIGVIATTSTLTQELLITLQQAGLGISTLVAIGNNLLPLFTLSQALSLFESDPDTSKIVLVSHHGIGGERQAAEFISRTMTKPVIAHVVGHTLTSRDIHHLGDFDQPKIITAAPEKVALLMAAGARIADHIGEIPTFFQNLD